MKVREGGEKRGKAREDIIAPVVIFIFRDDMRDDV